MWSENQGNLLISITDNMSGVLDNVEDFFPTLHPDVIVRSLPLPWHGLFGSLAASVHHARDWLAKQHQDVTMRRLEASKNPPLWHDLLESLTAQVAFLLCDRKIGMYVDAVVWCSVLILIFA